MPYGNEKHVHRNGNNRKHKDCKTCFCNAEDDEWWERYVDIVEHICPECEDEGHAVTVVLRMGAECYKRWLHEGNPLEMCPKRECQTGGN